MDKFRVVLNIANKQSNLGFGLLALLTAGGEQIFSSVVFSCPCNELNFIYGLVFLLVPGLALLLLGYILNKKTWKLLTGLCHGRAKLCSCKRLRAAVTVLFQINTTALVAPFTWIAVALLNGNYYECLMTGTKVSPVQHLCGKSNSKVPCENLHRFPCKDDRVLKADREDVLLALKAQSQILGWLLIASVMLSNLLLTCLAQCSSPISYLQLKFWRAYAQEEGELIESYNAKHAKELAQRNLQSFFNQKPAEPIITPSNKEWEKISSLYKFSTKGQYYSTLHRYVETCQESDDGMMRMASIASSGSADGHPAVLQFVDDCTIPV
ncbi:calcium homeostasis modulator protein 6-like [Hippoglossus hippoglossus]|uniref:calcium homeostasis modulator protein 6-like n=1 Tax=Hippoglossus hippoglossus TaxID=8267 RepID=UPI00148CDE51|nr:calcium homeostasis modulator protein 6-like [Hippoglossus hippoglossus]